MSEKNASEPRRARRIDRLQNLTILLLTASAFSLFLNLPLFGSLSDRSILELLRGRLRREAVVTQTHEAGLSSMAFPVRMVCTSDYARLGSDSLTTLSDEFERAGTYLGEAIGSAANTASVGQYAFLAALRGEGLYFDFASALPAEVLTELLGVTLPAEAELASVRRILLVPAVSGSAALYVEDGTGQFRRFTTAASSAALSEFLAGRGGGDVDFAYLMGPEYSFLAPLTLIAQDSERPALSAYNALAANESAFLRLAEFNAHTENRFTESSGTVIVREVSSTLYLRPDGTVSYQGAEAAPDSLYRISAAEPGSPTPTEVMRGAHNLTRTLLGELLGDAELYLSGVRTDAGRTHVFFDLTVRGTPVRFSDGAHAADVTVEGESITAFVLKVRHYTLGEEPALLLPPLQAAYVSRSWEGAELSVAYVDGGGDEVLPVWIAE